MLVNYDRLGRKFFCLLLISMSNSVMANWTGVFSIDELPLQVVPNSVSASLTCKVKRGVKKMDFDPAMRLDGLHVWIEKQDDKDESQKWTRPWRRVLSPLANFVERVKPEGEQRFRYFPVPSQAVDALNDIAEPNSSAVELVEGIAAWASRPSTFIGELLPVDEYLLGLQGAARTSVRAALEGKFIMRTGERKISSTPLDARAGLPFQDLVQVFQEYFFPSPLYAIAAPSADEIRERLRRTHSETVGKLQRYEERRAEFGRWKRVDEAVSSLDLPDVTRELENAKNAEQSRIASGLLAGVEEGLRGAQYLGDRQMTSVAVAKIIPVSFVSTQTHLCGISRLEARAIDLLANMAAAKADLFVSQELRRSPVSFVGLGIGQTAISGLDDHLKELLRAFLVSGSTAMARRTAYEFFWVFSYHVSVEKKTNAIRIDPVLDGSETEESKTAAGAAARLLEWVAGSQTPEKHQPKTLPGRQRLGHAQ